MDALKKSNEELRDIRDHWEAKVAEFERQYANKRYELDKKIQEAETAVRNAKRMRLKELIADYPSSAYTIEIEYIKQPKCDRCNKNRMIPYVSPRGKTMYEACTCKDEKRRYHVKRAPLIEIREDCFGDVYPTYLVNTTTDESYLRTQNQFFDDIPFEEIKGKVCRPLFRDENRAKRFAEWMNKQESLK